MGGKGKKGEPRVLKGLELYCQIYRKLGAGRTAQEYEDAGMLDKVAAAAALSEDTTEFNYRLFPGGIFHKTPGLRSPEELRALCKFIKANKFKEDGKTEKFVKRGVIDSWGLIALAFNRKYPQWARPGYSHRDSMKKVPDSMRAEFTLPLLNTIKPRKSKKRQSDEEEESSSESAPPSPQKKKAKLSPSPKKRSKPTTTTTTTTDIDLSMYLSSSEDEFSEKEFEPESDEESEVNELRRQLHVLEQAKKKKQRTEKKKEKKMLKAQNALEILKQLAKKNAAIAAAKAAVKRAPPAPKKPKIVAPVETSSSDDDEPVRTSKKPKKVVVAAPVEEPTEIDPVEQEAAHRWLAAADEALKVDLEHEKNVAYVERFVALKAAKSIDDPEPQSPISWAGQATPVSTPFTSPVVKQPPSSSSSEHWSLPVPMPPPNKPQPETQPEPEATQVAESFRGVAEVSQEVPTQPPVPQEIAPTQLVEEEQVASEVHETLTQAVVDATQAPVAEPVATQAAVEEVSEAPKPKKKKINRLAPWGVTPDQAAFVIENPYYCPSCYKYDSLESLKKHFGVKKQGCPFGCRGGQYYMFSQFAKMTMPAQEWFGLHPKASVCAKFD
jgi:hypothetical protein